MGDTPEPTPRRYVTDIHPDADHYAMNSVMRAFEMHWKLSERQTVQARADRELEHRVNLARRGQLMGLSALVLILGTVILLSLTGHDWVAGAVALPGVFSIIAVFVTGKYDPPPTEKVKSEPSAKDADAAIQRETL
jgi:hypothetical protein